MTKSELLEHRIKLRQWLMLKSKMVSDAKFISRPPTPRKLGGG